MLAESLQELRLEYPRWFARLLLTLPAGARLQAQLQAEGRPSQEILFRMARGRDPRAGETLSPKEMAAKAKEFSRDLPVISAAFDDNQKLAVILHFRSGKTLHSRHNKYREPTDWFQRQVPPIYGCVLDVEKRFALLYALERVGVIKNSFQSFGYDTEEYYVNWGNV